MAMVGDIVYTMRVGNRDDFDMAKWVDGEVEPDATWSIYQPPRYICGCASFRSPCKHVPIRDALWAAAKKDVQQLHKWGWSESRGAFLLGDV